jgi:drug/metabolite transporter (DMT)-like permease
LARGDLENSDASTGHARQRTHRPAACPASRGEFVIALASGNGPSVPAGALLVLGAAIAQAGFFVIEKPLLRRCTPSEMTTYAMITGAIILLPFADPAP